MKKYMITAGVVLGLTVLSELYFGTVFNESVRNIFDVPAMLFVAPGLLLNHFLNLGLPFDGPNHSSVIWISGAVYAGLALGAVAVVQKLRMKLGQQQRG
jgi:hypothetical protein